MRTKTKFMEYITRPLRDEEVAILYKANNIVFEKTELYLDFVLSLYDRIIDSFLGEDVIKEDMDIKNHFDWCWNKVIDDFKKEDINFKDKNKELYDYFYGLFYESFYMMNKDESDNIVDFYKLILSYTNIKTRSDLDAMLEVYRLFDKSF